MVIELLEDLRIAASAAPGISSWRGSSEASSWTWGEARETITLGELALS
ncbi:MAG: hypothetical protein NDJ89_03705 [Oligoflexia bacterium]|nr:hypothetical protein [Oligoflexia bacterium]